MKVVMINGSPNEKGCTFTGLSIIKDQLLKHGVESEIFHVGKDPIRGCTACYACKKGDTKGKCVFNDDMVNKVADEFSRADGLILGTAVHYASVAGTATSFFDRMFFSQDPKKRRLKFGAAIVSCRRGGNSSTFDQLNKYFTISQMPVVSSCYWNGIHGSNPDEVYKDEEGVRIMRTLANNFAYLIKMKHAANIELPEEEPKAFTNFIRS